MAIAGASFRILNGNDVLEHQEKMFLSYSQQVVGNLIITYVGLSGSDLLVQSAQSWS